jgi:uncharacterized protein YciI
VKPLSEVDRHMRAHVKFLQEHYAAKTFIATGRRHDPAFAPFADEETA